MLKEVKKLVKKSSKKEESDSLVDNMHEENTETTCNGKQQTGSIINSAAQNGPGVEETGKTVLHFLKQSLSGSSNTQDLTFAAEELKRWGQQNGFTENGYTQDRPCEYLQEIDQFVQSHFPTLPANGSQGCYYELKYFLNETEKIISNEVGRLTAALKDAGLLDHLKDSYSRHLFTNLDLLLNKDLSVKEIFCLIMWGKDVFFRQDSQNFIRVYDPLLLTGWFENAKMKLLKELQNYISTNLQKILHYDEQHAHNGDSMGEETFISVHLDVTQCLNCVISDAKKVGLTLMNAVQILCIGELHVFVQKYVKVRKRYLKTLKFPEKNSVYLFRIINTCMQLRLCAANISPNKNDSNEKAISCMLQELEDHTSSIVEKIIKCLAQCNLRSYFKTRDEQIRYLTEAIKKQCASLPQTTSEIKMVIVKIAYNSVSKVYLECLMKTKFRNLERCWGNAEEKIQEDIHHFQKTFSELNGTAFQQKQLLERMSEVLHCSDVEALKKTCACLFTDFPKDSEQYVPGLLRWKGVFSEPQVREVIRDLGLNLNPKSFNCQSLKRLFCCGSTV